MQSSYVERGILVRYSSEGIGQIQRNIIVQTYQQNKSDDNANYHENWM